jgi:hypothetical protein
MFKIDIYGCWARLVSPLGLFKKQGRPAAALVFFSFDIPMMIS